MSTQVKPEDDIGGAPAMPPDIQFDTIRATTFTVLNIGPEQGKLLNHLISAAYYRGRTSGLDDAIRLMNTLCPAPNDNK